jgi:hypothetical protein
MSMFIQVWGKGDLPDVRSYVSESNFLVASQVWLLNEWMYLQISSWQSWIVPTESYVKTNLLFFRVSYSTICGKPYSLMLGVPLSGTISDLAIEKHWIELSFEPYHTDLVMGSWAKQFIGSSISYSFLWVPKATSVRKTRPSLPAVIIWDWFSADWVICQIESEWNLSYFWPSDLSYFSWPNVWTTCCWLMSQMQTTPSVPPEYTTDSSGLTNKDLTKLS